MTNDERVIRLGSPYTPTSSQSPVPVSDTPYRDANLPEAPCADD